MAGRRGRARGHKTNSSAKDKKLLAENSGTWAPDGTPSRGGAGTRYNSPKAAGEAIGQEAQAKRKTRRG